MIVHVTPGIASRWEDPFIDSAASASFRDSGVDNVELAKALLEPFDIVPVTTESLRDALNKNLPRRIPVSPEVWESLKDDEAAQRTFCQLDKLTDGGRITSAVDSAFKCVAEGKHRNMDSGMVRMGSWITVFDNLWDILLELVVSDTSVHYTRDTASWVAASASSVAASSDYGNLSLKTHNKEVVMFAEVSGKGSDASYQARKRLNTLLPKYFQSMNCMVLFSTKETNFRVMAAYAEHTGGISSIGILNTGSKGLFHRHHSID